MRAYTGVALAARGAQKWGGEHAHEKRACVVKACQLVQDWGEAFLTQRQVAKYADVFVTAYHDLAAKGSPALGPRGCRDVAASDSRAHVASGIKFPKQYDESRAPVFTPPAHSHESSGGSGDARARRDSGAARSRAGSDARVPPTSSAAAAAAAAPSPPASRSGHAGTRLCYGAMRVGVGLEGCARRPSPRVDSPLAQSLAMRTNVQGARWWPTWCRCCGR